MRMIRKLIAGSDERSTRLHDRRGNLTSIKEWCRLPALLLERRRDLYKSPWMAQGSIKALERILQSDMTLLELGSGTSTAWYAERVGQVISLEPDPVWAALTSKATANCNNVALRIGKIGDLAPAILAENVVDVVVVDHCDEASFSRLDALTLLGPSVSLVVLDDSDRAQYSNADDLMRDWTKQRFVSLRANPLVPTETTIFTRHLR